MNNKTLELSVTEIRGINGDTQDTVIAVPVASRIDNTDGTILVIQEKDLSAGILEDTAAVLRQTSQYEYKYNVISGHLYYIRNGLQVLGSRYDVMIKQCNDMIQRMEQNEIKPTSFFERFKNYFKGEK
jgi:hypothetical protein